MISEGLMFQTLLLTCVSSENGHPSLTSVVGDDGELRVLSSLETFLGH